MAKKVYDIVPPKEAERKKATAEKKPRTVRKNPAIKRVARKAEQPMPVFSEIKTSVKKIPDRPQIIKPLIIGACALVMLVALFLFFKLPKAEITIWPKVEVLSYKQTVTADKSVQSIDEAKAIVPAQYFEEIKDLSQDFPATGNASNEGKAGGQITIYNKISPAEPLTLKAGTHFLSDRGKYFVTLAKVTVPAAKSKSSPGSVRVRVEAVEGGDSYNIQASSFSVPKLSGTVYYYGIYAESTDSMSGGYASKVKKVTEDDIQLAKETLVKKLTDTAISGLKSKIPQDYILLENSFNSEMSNAKSLAKASTVADTFTYQATVKASGLAFKKSDLEKFAKDYASSRLEAGKTILDKNFTIDYSATKVDIKGGKATVILTFSSGSYVNASPESLAQSLPGKNESQVKETINSAMPGGVSKIEVKLWPFWVTKVPGNQKAVKVDFKFE